LSAKKIIPKGEPIHTTTTPLKSPNLATFMALQGEYAHAKQLYQRAERSGATAAGEDGLRMCNL